MAIKFRKFWKRNPAEQIHNTRRRKETHITNDDLKIYVECPACGSKGTFVETIKMSNGIYKNNVKICQTCFGLGEIDSGKQYEGKK